jgi:hypothetical protein
LDNAKQTNHNFNNFLNLHVVDGGGLDGDDFLIWLVARVFLQHFVHHRLRSVENISAGRIKRC